MNDQRHRPILPFRWLLLIPGIDSFLLKEISELVMHAHGLESFYVTLYDCQSTQHVTEILGWLNSNSTKDIELKLLNDIGDTIEAWMFNDVKLITITFSSLSYVSDEPHEPRTIKLLVKPGSYTFKG